MLFVRERMILKSHSALDTLALNSMTCTHNFTFSWSRQYSISGSCLFLKINVCSFSPYFSLACQKLMCPELFNLNASVIKASKYQPFKNVCSDSCLLLACLPSAVQESHPCGATAGHPWWMEPKGGGAFAIGSSLVAIITVMIRADKTRNSYPIRNHRGNTDNKTDARIPEAFVWKIQF